MDKTFKDIEFSLNGLDYNLGCSFLDSKVLLYILRCDGLNGSRLFSIVSNSIYYCEMTNQLELTREFVTSGQLHGMSLDLGKKIMDWSREHDEYILSVI